MRPDVERNEAEVYECFTCGGRAESANGGLCPSCGGELRHLGHSRDL